MSFLLTRWVITTLFGVFFLLFTVLNGSIVFSVYVMGKKGSSLFPLVGGFLGMLAVLIVPVEGWERYWWVPFFVDVGSVPLLLNTLVFWAKNKLR